MDTTQEDAVTEDAPNIPAGYHLILAGTLRVGSITGFNIFTVPESDHSPVLYTRRNTAISEDVYKNLIALKSNPIYIEKGDLDIYLGFVEESLGAILDSDDLTTPEKVAVMYDCARRVARGLLSVTDVPNFIPRARTLVIALSDFVLRSEDFIQSFVKVCDYSYSESTHCVNVLMYSLSFIQRMGIRDVGWIHNFSVGALLLDVGKNGVDKTLLDRNGPLNPSQLQTLQRHPVYGSDILKSHGIIDEVVLNIVKHHHEKLNGKGYPDGLHDDQVPKYVRIVTICDIFDTLTTKRPYSEATDTFSALKLMHAKMVGEIDPDLFKIFVKMMSSIK